MCSPYTDWSDGAEIQYTEDAADGGVAEGGGGEGESKGGGECGGTMTIGD